MENFKNYFSRKLNEGRFSNEKDFLKWVKDTIEMESEYEDSSEDNDNPIDDEILGFYNYLLKNSSKIKDDIEKLVDKINDIGLDKFTKLMSIKKSKPSDWINTDEDWKWFNKF